MRNLSRMCLFMDERSISLFLFSIEEGERQKQRQRSSILFGEGCFHPNLKNLPGTK